MDSSRSQTVRVAAALLLVAVLAPAASARVRRVQSAEAIARSADVISVGEVMEVLTVGPIAAEQTQWRRPLLQKEAVIRVLRSFSKPGKASLTEGEVLRLPFLAIDPKHNGRWFEGPQFPNLSVGDIRGFPLRQTGPPGATEWEILYEEDGAQLIPCVRDPLTSAARNSALRCLEAELAGTFAGGRYPDLYETARKLAELDTSDEELLDRVHGLLVRHGRVSEGRWLEIAVATYCAMGTPASKSHPPITIAGLRDAPEAVRWSTAPFAARALSHVPRVGLEGRFLGVAMRHADIHRTGTYHTISTNYSPIAFTVVQEALQGDVPEALPIAERLIRDATSPLIPPAVDAARRVLLRRDEAKYLGTACSLIRRWGDERDFSLLLDEIRDAQGRDLDRYTVMWLASFDYAKSERTRSIQVLAIAIDDRRIAGHDPSAASRGIRFCDKAAYDLQKFTGVDFGFQSGDSPADRDRAIRRVGAWLAQNVSSASS